VPELTPLEKQQLSAIADAIERKATTQLDEAIVAGFIKKCLVRSSGKTFKLTPQGQQELKN